MSDRRSLWIVLVLWIAVVVIPLPVREVMPPDESRFTHQAENMKESGDLGVPRIGDIPNSEKPPLLFWAINLFSLPLARVNEVTARLPSALAALGVLLLTLHLGRRLWASPEVGLAGAAILITGVEFAQKAEWTSCDMLLALFALATITLWREALFEPRAGEPGEASATPHWPIFGGWLCAALGTLTKGPVALLWPLFWIAAEASARRRWRPVLALLCPAGPLLFAALVGGWLAAFGARAGTAGVSHAVFAESITRYLAAWNARQPFWFFLGQTPLDLLPWSFFLPAAVVFTWRRWRRRDEADAVALRATVWFVLVALVFFSASSGKRGVYLLPAFPAVALLTARVFLGAGRPVDIRAPWRDVPLRVLAALGLILGVCAPLAVIVGWIPKATEWSARVGRAWLGALCVAGLALAAGALLALANTRRGRVGRGLGFLAGGLAIFFVALGTVGGAAWSRYQNAGDFGRRIAALVAPDERVAVERGKFELILFYSRRRGTEFQGDGELAQLLKDGRERWVVLSEPTWRRLQSQPPFSAMRAFFTEKVGNTTFCVLGPPDA